MNSVVVLDTGPLGLLTHPKQTSARDACERWLQSLIAAGCRVIVPEIADYELRRELLRARKRRGLRRLNDLESRLEYLPIATSAMRRAAELWADARQTGQPTAGDDTIDVDMNLIAQVQTLGIADAIIATTNVSHLSRFTRADNWQNVK